MRQPRQSSPRLLGTHAIRRETVESGAGAITVTFLVPEADSPAADRLVQNTERAITRLVDWLGPLPTRSLVVVDVPWHAGVAGASYPGVAITSTRWLSTRRDFAPERPLLAALARQYTFSIAPAGRTVVCGRSRAVSRHPADPRAS